MTEQAHFNRSIYWYGVFPGCCFAVESSKAKHNMKHITLISATLITLSTSAQDPVTISTGQGNSQQVFYSLSSGVQATAPLATWDLAFEITGFTGSILVNTAKGLTVYETPAAITAWESVSTPDEANWTPIHNSDTDWSQGALTYGNDLEQPDGLNLGWGTYNMITHTIAGTKIYVIADGQGGYHKLRINSLMGGVYDFTYAGLDGGNEVNGSLAKPAFASKNFAYWSMSAHAALDPEPPTADWELLFTKYIGFIPTPYALAGVLHNKGIEVLQVDGVPAGQADPWSGPYSMDINTIGADWKTFDMNTFQWTFAEDRTYFVKDHAGSIWALIFTGYGGTATGEMTFTQELVSVASIEEQAQLAFALYPNPVRDGRLSMVLDAPMSQALLSLHDASGRLVHEQLLTGIDGLSPRMVDVTALRPGLYLARVQAQGHTRAARFVVE